MRRLIAVVATLFSTSAFATPEDAKLAMVAWSAWECHIYAQKAGDTIESRRLFNLGTGAASEFVDKVRAGKISGEDTFEYTPLSVLEALEGPNSDFIIGRIYQLIASASFDGIAKRRADGSSLEVKDWIEDPAILKSIAETKYRLASCITIKR